MKYFDTASGSMRLTHGFCQKMASETLNFNLFRFNEFILLARMYGQFLLSCDKNGIYTPELRLKHHLQFFRPKGIKKHMEECAEALANNDDGYGLALCDDYCAHFNPVSYDQLLEGGFARVLGFRFWANKQLSQKMAEDPRLSVKADLSYMGRLLADEKPAEATKVVKVNQEQITFKSLNKKYSTYFLRPVTYNYQEDFRIRRMFSIRRRIFHTSPTNLFDLKRFTIFIAAKGLNFFKYGLQSKILESKLLESDPASFAKELQLAPKIVILADFIAME